VGGRLENDYFAVEKLHNAFEFEQKFTSKPEIYTEQSWTRVQPWIGLGWVGLLNAVIFHQNRENFKPLLSHIC